MGRLGSGVRLDWVHTECWRFCSGLSLISCSSWWKNYCHNCHLVNWAVSLALWWKSAVGLHFKTISSTMRAVCFRGVVDGGWSVRRSSALRPAGKWHQQSPRASVAALRNRRGARYINQSISCSWRPVVMCGSRSLVRPPPRQPAVTHTHGDRRISFTPITICPFLISIYLPIF